MNIKRILCPIDFSEFNHAANEYASMLAQSTGARIIYLHAFFPSPYETPPIYFDGDKTEKDLLKKMEDFVTPAASGIDASYVVEFGTITDRIVNYANQNDIDMVVIGTHGRTGIGRVLMGSVAEAVVRGAQCPVLTVKSADQATATTPSASSSTCGVSQ